MTTIYVWMMAHLEEMMSNANRKTVSSQASDNG